MTNATHTVFLDTPGLRPRATFYPHSQIPGAFVGTFAGKAYVLQPCGTDHGRGFVLCENELGTALLEAAK